MAVDIAALRVRLIADTKDYKKNMQGASKQTKGWSQNMKALSGVLGGFSAAIAIRQVLAFGRASVDAASVAEESASKFRVVFGERAEEIQKLLNDEATAINRSGVEWMDYAATIQDTLVPLGFARNAAADMSVEVVKLAEDLASFNNLDTKRVVADIQTAIVGNTEVLRKYGVVAQQVQIEQEAVNSGLVESKDQITANIKAQAILNLIYQGTTDAQGDAARTADSYANVQKGLEAATLDLKVAIGDALIPTMTELAKESTSVVRSLGDQVTASTALRNAVDSGLISSQEWLRLSRLIGGSSEDLAEVERVLAQRTDELSEAYKIIDGSVESYDRKLLNAANTSEQMAIAQENAKMAMDDLKLWMDGPVGESIEKFTEREKDLREEAEEIRQKIDELEKQGYPSHHDKIQEQEDALADVEQQINDNAAAHEDATKRMVADLLIQRIALADIKGGGVALQLAVLEGFDLIDEGTKNLASGLDDVIAGVDDGTLSMLDATEVIEDLAAEAHGLEGDYELRFNITTTGKDLRTIMDLAPQGKFVGGRATGGPLFRGQSAVVGEDGPELAVANQDLTIFNQQQMNLMGGSGDNGELLGEIRGMRRDFKTFAKSAQTQVAKGSAL